MMGGFTISRPAGGGLPAWVPTNSVWVFDLAASAWSKGVPVPTPRGALTATAVGTKIYAIGGARNPSYSTPEVRPMPTARNHHGAARIDGRIYVVGGRVGSTFIIGLSSDAHAAARPRGRRDRRRDLRGERRQRRRRRRAARRRSGQRGLRPEVINARNDVQGDQVGAYGRNGIAVEPAGERFDRHLERLGQGGRASEYSESAAQRAALGRIALGGTPISALPCIHDVSPLPP